MKRICYFLALVLVTSCSLLKQQTNFSYVTDKNEQLSILYEHYPKLWEYYKEGVMDIAWIKKYVNEQGDIEYKEKHYLKSKTIDDYSEKMSLLKLNFPEVYNLFTLGKVSVDSMYKYVGDEGNVKVHISYHHL